MKIGLHLLKLIIAIACIFACFIYSESNYSYLKNTTEIFDENHKEEKDVNEHYFLQRSYPDAAIDMVAYDKAMKQALKDSKIRRENRASGSRVTEIVKKPVIRDVPYRFK